MQSMIVEATPPAVPPSSTSATADPSVASASMAVTAGASPCLFALVVASGPVRSSTARVKSCAGTRAESVDLYVDYYCPDFRPSPPAGGFVPA